MPYPLPTEHERRALFSWLKQASSLSAWRRLYTFNQAFVDVVRDVYEQEQNTVGAAVTIATSHVADVLRDHDAFAKALERLAKGDRRCFLFLGAPGHFSQGLLSVQWWQDMYFGVCDNRNGFGPAESPRWPEIERVMRRCLDALLDIAVVLQKRFTDMPAWLDSLTYFKPQLNESLMEYLLAQPTLARVPAPEEPELLVKTGRTIPCYGIWEPVKVSQPPGFLGAFRSALPAPAEGRPLDGCMNYLHGDVAAPTIGFPEDGQRHEGRATTWRLLWRDERYGVNPAPVEEASYVFIRPVDPS